MDASMSDAKGKEKVGKLYTNEERKKWKKQMSLETSCLMSLCSVPIPVSSPEDPVGEGDATGQVTKLKSFLLPLRLCRIPPTSSSALSFAHCALAMLVFAFCWSSQPLLTLLYFLCLGYSSTRHLMVTSLCSFKSLLYCSFLKKLLKIADSILSFPPPPLPSLHLSFHSTVTF